MACAGPRRVDPRPSPPDRRSPVTGPNHCVGRVAVHISTRVRTAIVRGDRLHPLTLPRSPGSVPLTIGSPTRDFSTIPAKIPQWPGRTLHATWREKAVNQCRITVTDASRVARSTLPSRWPACLIASSARRASRQRDESSPHPTWLPLAAPLSKPSIRRPEAPTNRPSSSNCQAPDESAGSPSPTTRCTPSCPEPSPGIPHLSSAHRRTTNQTDQR